MSYEKHSWTSQKTANDLVTPARLRNIETQYEKALVDARVNNTQLDVQVASSAASGATAMVYFNSTDNKLYGYNGTSWIMLGVE